MEKINTDNKRRTGYDMQVMYGVREEIYPSLSFVMHLNLLQSRQSLFILDLLVLCL